MITVVLGLTIFLLFLGGVYLYFLLVTLRRRVERIMEVLASASPSLERRIVESGTRVVLPPVWQEDVVDFIEP